MRAEQQPPPLDLWVTRFSQEETAVVPASRIPAVAAVGPEVWKMAIMPQLTARQAAVLEATPGVAEEPMGWTVSLL
jgi:hypothetical protein